MVINSISLSIVFALSGLGLFLVAVRIMSSSIKLMTSGFTTSLLKKISKNKWIGFIFGILFTTMIQSSDGTIAIVIGLISASMLSLRNAIPIILGANIGTATTAIIVAFGGSTVGWVFSLVKFLPLLVFLSSAILLFVKEEKKVNVAMLIFAIGTIFLGLKIMGAGMKSITRTNNFKEVVSSVGSSPWISLFTLSGLTGVVQSSSATVTVVQTIYYMDETGYSAITLPSAISMVIGANIGTTFTALITSIGKNRDAKRIGVIWFITNLSMALIIMPLIYLYSKLIEIMNAAPVPIKEGGKIINIKFINTNKKFQLATAHMLFNTFLSLTFIWFVKPLEWISKKIIPQEKNKKLYSQKINKQI